MIFTTLKQKLPGWGLILITVAVLGACGSGQSLIGDSPSPDNGVVEAGNPPSSGKPRKLEGSMPVEKNGQCFADEFEAYDIAGKLVITPVNTDCTFSTSLKSGKAWGVRFYRQGAVVGVMLFQNGKDLPLSFVYYTSESANSVNFGKMHFSSGWAYPELQPATQNDRDGDGQSDYVDADDDNDGILDAVEADCDGNHIWDDLEMTDC